MMTKAISAENKTGSFSYVCDQKFHNTVIFLFGKPYTTFIGAKAQKGEWGNR